MVGQALTLFEQVFSACAGWTTQLLDAVGGAGVVLAAICMVIAVSLLLIPIRGSGGDFAAYTRDFTSQRIHNAHGRNKFKARRSFRTKSKVQGVK